MDRPINARYVVEQVVLKDGEHIDLHPRDEVIGSSWDHPFTYITVLRYQGNDHDERD